MKLENNIKNIGRVKSVLVQLSGGQLATLIVVIQGLVLFPMYLNYLGERTYGIWLATGGIISALSLMDFGIGRVISQKVADSYSKSEFQCMVDYFINGMIVSVLFSALTILVGFIVSIFIPKILELNENSKLIVNCFQFAVLSLSISMLAQCMSCFSQSILKPQVSSILKVVSRIFAFVVVVISLKCNLGLWSAVIGLLSSAILMFSGNFIYALILLRDVNHKPRIKRKLLKHYLVLSPSLIGAKASMVLGNKLEPLMIAIFISPEMTSLYAVSKKGIEIIVRVVDTINNSVFPSLSHLIGDGNQVKIDNKLKLVFIATTLISLVGVDSYIVLNNSFIGLWVGDNKIISNYIAALLGAGYFVALINRSNINCLNAFGDFKSTSIITIIENLFRFIVMLIALQFFGITGFVISTLLSSIMFSSIYVKRLRIYNYYPLSSIETGGVVAIFISIVLSSLACFMDFKIVSWIEFFILMLLNLLVICLFICLTFKSQILDLINVVKAVRIRNVRA